MTVLTAAALIALVAVAAAVLFLLVRLSAETAAARASAEGSGRTVHALSAALESRLRSFEATIDTRIKESQAAVGQNLGTMQQQSAESARLLKAVGENLGRVFEASQKIERLAGDVTRLEDLLKPPKLRGTLGETFLEEALRQVLPAGTWQMQRRFADGETVDAAIMIGDRFVPIDSKFPLENYRRALESPDEGERKRAKAEFRRDVRKHVDAIAAKYIRVSEGTYEFAMMYVPAEAVYAEIVADGDEAAVADYAQGKRIVPVSPRLLYAYLATVAQGLKGLEIGRRAHEIVEELARLKRGVSKIEEPFGKLGGHLNNAQKQYEETARQLARFTERLREVAESEDLPGQPQLPLQILPPDEA